MKSERDILKEINKKKKEFIDIFFILVMILSFLIGCFAGRCSAQEFLITDFDFTNQNYTMQITYKFCKSFKNNPLNYDNIETIIRYCHIYKIHPLPVLTKLQMESDLLVRCTTNKSIIYLKNRAMGYGLAKNFKRDGKKFYIFGGYDIQIYRSIKRFRELFDEWYPGIKKIILDLDKKIIPKNAASYALYRYTPFYGKHNYYEWKKSAVGNKAFIELFKKYKIKWDNL